MMELMVKNFGRVMVHHQVLKWSRMCEPEPLVQTLKNSVVSEPHYFSKYQVVRSATRHYSNQMEHQLEQFKLAHLAIM